MSIASTAAQIADQLYDGYLLYVATDDRRAEALASAVADLCPDATTVFVPATDALPGDDAPASPSNAGQRASALRRLRKHNDCTIACFCITSVEAVARRVAAPDAFDAAPPTLRIGDAIDHEALTQRLLELGYVTDDRVDEPGEIAMRGAVIDIFPADATLPVRIELEAGKIVGLRSYDPVTQRTTEELAVVNIGRANEPAATGDGTLLDHLPAGVLVMEAGVEERRKRFQALADDASRHGRGTSDALDDEALRAAFAPWTRLELNDDYAPVPRFVEHKMPLKALARFAKPLAVEGARIVLMGSARDLRFLQARVARALKIELDLVDSWAEARALPPGSAAAITIAADAGFVGRNIFAVASADLLGSRAGRDDESNSPSISVLDGLSEIQLGDVIVHENHGVGVVRGVEAMPATGEEDSAGDAIVLEFANEARRLVPAEQADRLWRYGADADAVALDTLDGSSWEKGRAEIGVAIAKDARALTALAREREAKTAPVIDPDPDAYERFASGFPFIETADQARAIDAVRADLASGKPTDRLVIGDVGYGKTEVALRAAALVALASGQIAIAAPTTVLVRQHLELFRRRFEATGIVVEGLSRLSSPADRKRVKTGLANGSVSIVVGTAAVASKDAAWSNLQLVVIDEEQRFGAADKAKLRALHDGHVLTLSATPIPRTMQTALVGLQELSVIATPPARRQPIRTTVDSWDDTRVRTALLREKTRRGQSFVVVPRIDDMAMIEDKLRRIVPEVSVVAAHGKLPAAELDEAMIAFADGRGDVLLATNIIEAGLDVPRANTMVVWRADRFGLSQLHQLRGRVGRGSRRGQILLLTEAETKIADRTLKRLNTLQAFDRLGAGFAISARDLDMRGAGDLLGDSQTGHMKLIGIDLYQHLLESALREARGENADRWLPELRLGASGRLPQDWIPEVEVRVALYARLARIENLAALDAFEDELEDRFGALPDDARMLLDVARIRILAKLVNVARIDAGPAAIALTPRAKTLSGAKEIGLEKVDERLILRERIDDAGERLTRTADLLSALLEHET